MTSHEVDSWVLVQAAQQGDMDAYAELWQRHTDVVYRFVLGRTGDRPLAEDITAETFLRALLKLETVSDQGQNAEAWFVTIAKNILFDHFKSSRNRLDILTGEFLDTGTELDPADIVVRAETALAVRRLMGVLNDAENACITQRFLNDRTLAETAVALDRTVLGIKSLQIRALHKLHARAASPEDRRARRVCANVTCAVILGGLGLYCTAECQRTVAAILGDPQPGTHCIIPSCHRPLIAAKRKRCALVCSGRCMDHLRTLRAVAQTGVAA
jgi:RNA polymerase sigma-70 factor (ECF subfamily)